MKHELAVLTPGSVPSVWNAEHVARGGDRARHEAVDATELEHHAAEVDALRAERLLRSGQIDELALLCGLLLLLGVPRLEICSLKLGVALGVVDHLDAALRKGKTGGRLCGGNLLRGAKHNRSADLAVDTRACGRDDTSILALGKNDSPVKLRCAFYDFLDGVHG